MGHALSGPMSGDPTADLKLDTHLDAIEPTHHFSNSSRISEVYPDISFLVRLLPRANTILREHEVGTCGLLEVRRRIWSPPNCNTRGKSPTIERVVLTVSVFYLAERPMQLADVLPHRRLSFASLFIPSQYHSFLLV